MAISYCKQISIYVVGLFFAPAIVKSQSPTTMGKISIVSPNAASLGKFVDIEVIITENAVNISVHDCGKGFKPEAIPDPTKEENLYTTNGRGVFLIKTLADDVQFDFGENGTTVNVKFVV